MSQPPRRSPTGQFVKEPEPTIEVKFTEDMLAAAGHMANELRTKGVNMFNTGIILALAAGMNSVELPERVMPAYYRMLRDAAAQGRLLALKVREKIN